MSEKELRAAIKTIRSELAEAGGVTGHNKEELLRLAADLEARLEAKGPQEGDEALRKELSDWVVELEASHPKLSSTIGRVVDTLALFNL